MTRLRAHGHTVLAWSRGKRVLRVRTPAGKRYQAVVYPPLAGEKAKALHRPWSTHNRAERYRQRVVSRLLARREIDERRVLEAWAAQPRWRRWARTAGRWIAARARLRRAGG